MQILDSVQSFMFEHADIRGHLIHLEQAYQQMMSQQNYPPAIQSLLAQVIMAAAFIAVDLKTEGEVSLQLIGDERLPLLLAQCTHDLKIRASARFLHEMNAEVYEDAFLKGTLSLVVHSTQKSDAYRSIVPLISTSIAENLMHYFSQSMQIPTYIQFCADDLRCSGFFLQSLPKENEIGYDDFWTYALKIGETLTAEELLLLPYETILHRLYHETTLRVFPLRTICFECRCSVEKMGQAIRVLGLVEAEALLKAQGCIEICCEFCHRQYVFDSIDVAYLFKRQDIGSFIDIQDIIDNRRKNAQRDDHYKK